MARLPASDLDDRIPAADGSPGNGPAVLGALHLTPGIEATLVPASRGGDRNGDWGGDSEGGTRLALWHRRLPVGPDQLTLVLPGPGGPRRTTVSARLYPVAHVVADLVQLPASAEVSPSVAAWSVAAKLAVDLVARGRIRPGIDRHGHAAWRLGPLDPDDHARTAQLVDRLPTEAHATPLAGRRPLRLPAKPTAMAEFFDTVADSFVRTAAAPVSGGGPFATAQPTLLPIDLLDWLSDTGSAAIDDAQFGLRLTLPDGPEGAFAALVQVRSNADPSLVLDASALWDAPGPVLARMGDDIDGALLVALRRGARVWPPLARLLDQARPEMLELDDGETAELLGDAAGALADVGIEVLWPSSLVGERVVLSAVVGTPAPGKVVKSTFTLDTLLDFTWEASVGGLALTQAEVSALAEAKRPLVRVRGRWVLADPELADRLRRRQGRIDGAEALAAALSGSVVVDGESVPVRAAGPLAHLTSRLTSGGARQLAEPPGLHAELRPYQRRGLAWLVEMVDLGLGGCLADDMGLGKTVQVIALHLHRMTGGSRTPMLVVCPTTLLGNWERELHRFAPGLTVRRYHGGDRHLDHLADGEVVLATYGVVLRDAAALREGTWGLIVADEAQHVKNPLSKTARALRTIHGEGRVALTGTPVENRLTELWAILDYTTPGLLGPLEAFRRRVALPIERNQDPEATEKLSNLVRPFLLRRRKTDPNIAPELPAKTETDDIVPLSAEQVTLYEAVVRESLAEIAQQEGIARRGLVLKLLTGLKQICNHPAQYLHQRGPLNGRSGKLDTLDELLAAMVDGGESVLIFSQYVAMLRLIERHLGAGGTPTLFLHGGVPATRRDTMVTSFQAGEVPVFLLSLKAGGTGLNLTRATQVVHFDRWWNPAVEDQASDRAWRIGQDKPVQVHRLVTEGTIEDRIAALLESKRRLAESVVGAGEGWISELSDTELADLVELRSDR
jgi:superfamily II DNA or RNA helicase